MIIREHLWSDFWYIMDIKIAQVEFGRKYQLDRLINYCKHCDGEEL